MGTFNGILDKDLRVIGYYTGYIVIGVGLIMLIPLVTALGFAEWSTAVDFTVSFFLTIAVGYLLVFVSKSERQRVTWMQGMVIAALSWVIATFLAAMPYWLSGHYNSYLDAMFDVMSGFTTTGLVLIQDLDHVSNGINMWRHVITYVGGQGIVVLALSFFSNNIGGGFKMYVGEAKDERLLPGVSHTARAIWIISLVYLVIGTAALWIANMFAGIGPVSAFFQAMWVYMAAWSTGGFAPHSQNILYYHSFVVEMITIIFSVIGSFNFALHYAVLSGNKKEIYRNIETVSFFITVTLLTVIVTIGLARANVYPDSMAMFRKGFYNLISGHTTTGFMSVYAQQFYNEWGNLAVFAVILSMLFGGSACSTAGGFKGLRIGIAFKTLIKEIEAIFLPESAVTVKKYHYIDDMILDDKASKNALLIIICYMAVFALGTGMGVYYGYPILSSMFESASATGNVGLSIGITSASMPSLLKITYMFLMWVGRLEFMSVFALIAFVISEAKRVWISSV